LSSTELSLEKQDDDGIQFASFLYKKSDTLYRQKRFQKPSIQKEILEKQLFDKWQVYEEWLYTDNLLYTAGFFPESASNDGIEDLAILYRDTGQELDVTILTDKICMDEEIRLSKYSAVESKENHCYPYTIKNNHIYIQKEDDTVEWEIIKLDKKEFWYRDVNTEDYRIYKCKKP